MDATAASRDCCANRLTATSSRSASSLNSSTLVTACTTALSSGSSFAESGNERAVDTLDRLEEQACHLEVIAARNAFTRCAPGRGSDETFRGQPVMHTGGHVVAPTSRSARPASFRPEIAVAGDTSASSSNSSEQSTISGLATELDTSRPTSCGRSMTHSSPFLDSPSLSTPDAVP